MDFDLQKLPIDETIALGDWVRSYDFEHRDNCFYEGVVMGIKRIEGCDRYIIRVTGQTWNGDRRGKLHRPTFVTPPVNGTPTLTGQRTNFVARVGSPIHESDRLDYLGG